MAKRYDLIVVGMGSAGMVAAELARTLGVEVAVVERDRVGGDCLWTGCVPSKALIASAKAAHTIRHAGKYGLEAAEPRIDTAAVWRRVHDVRRQISETDDDPERFVAMGVDVHRGPARLDGPNSVIVGDDQRIEARYILLCTGSRPVVPPIEGLASAGCITSESIFELDRPPDSLVMIGGGPISVELSQALVRLGVPTSVLQRDERILPRDEPELVDRLIAVLRSEGVDLRLRATVSRVRVEDGVKVVEGAADGEPASWRATEIFIGAGRAPNIEGLGLEQLGVGVGPRGVKVDSNMRTAVKSIYAVGDVAGRFLFTHSAGYEASTALRNMFFPGSSSATDFVPWCTFTDPELAHAGMTVDQARSEHGDGKVHVWRQELAHSDRARCDGATEGEIVIVTAKGRVVGAHVLAPSAGELIHELSLAIRQQLKLTELAGLVHVYPTLSIGIGQLAGEAAYESAQKYRWLMRTSG